MTLSRGVIEMIAYANKESRSFQDFTLIVIRGRALSSSTVAKRLAELVAIGVFAVSEERNLSTGRMVKRYTSTERGRRVLALAAEFAAVMRKKERK